MRVTSTVHQDIGVLTLIGEFGADSVLQFRQEIQAIRDQSIRDFVLDLSQVTRVDSLGLEAWTALQRECDEQLALLRLSGPNENLRKVLELTRLDGLFSIHDTVESAITSLSLTNPSVWVTDDRAPNPPAKTGNVIEV